MKLIIELEMRTAAFFYRSLEEELRHVLERVPAKVIEQLQRDPNTICDALEAADKLLDSNGNTVGTVRVEREDDQTRLDRAVRDFERGYDEILRELKERRRENG